jgi:predicted nucleotidyltransferase component of viral defense system
MAFVGPEQLGDGRSEVIDKREIINFSRELSLAPNVVEKDYVLGWLLAGIAQHPELSSTWIFKGGTCLKKCFFETYRFSEDLDFTITEPAQLNSEFLTKAFTEIAEWVYETAGIEIAKELIRFDVYTNPHGGTSVEGRISFRGPMQRERDLTRVRLDLTADEVLVLEPVMRKVHHPYTDNPGEGIEVRCYSFEEVFAEKIRALKERLRPRDLYDVVHLYRHDNLRPDRQVIMETLHDKCQFKGITIPTAQDFMDHAGRDELQAEWGNMLGHQLPALPPFQEFWRELPTVFDWLHGIVEKAAPPTFPVIAREVDETWRMPTMAQAWNTRVPLEVIRFAAANRLCVNLGYQGTRRLIEPYSLRRTQDGNLVLYAVRHDNGEDRSYRVDRIEGAEATQQSFSPRYTIELTPSGPVSAPPTSRRSSGLGLSRTRVARKRTRLSPSFGPTYVLECTYCGKRFNRKEYTTQLKPHKDKSGYPCVSRIGYMVDTKY